MRPKSISSNLFVELTRDGMRHFLGLLDRRLDHRPTCRTEILGATRRLSCDTNEFKQQNDVVWNSLYNCTRISRKYTTRDPPPSIMYQKSPLHGMVWNDKNDEFENKIYQVTPRCKSQVKLNQWWPIDCRSNNKNRRVRIWSMVVRREGHRKQHTCTSLDGVPNVRTALWIFGSAFAE
jgi:hypothetical protein